jgi:hypothetical protein
VLHVKIWKNVANKNSKNKNHIEHFTAADFEDNRAEFGFSCVIFKFKEICSESKREAAASDNMRVMRGSNVRQLVAEAAVHLCHSAKDCSSLDEALNRVDKVTRAKESAL